MASFALPAYNAKKGRVILETIGATSFIYAVTDDGLRHKIGHSSDLRRRMSTFQTGQATRLTLTAAIEVPRLRARPIEAAIHRDISWRKIRGEWFRLTLVEAKACLDHALIRWLDDPDIGPPATGDWPVLDPAPLPLPAHILRGVRP